jgi:hypothetical protein
MCSMTKPKYLALLIFGLAFGFVEAAVVFYLRHLINAQSGYLHHPYQILLQLGFINFIRPQNVLFGQPQIDSVEIAREFSTLVMLSAVAYLAASRWRARLGAFFITFATWDLSYYLFLKLTAAWPQTLFDLDIFFLIPIPWVGPVITPLATSSLLLALGSYLFLTPQPPNSTSPEITSPQSSPTRKVIPSS